MIRRLLAVFSFSLLGACASETSATSPTSAEPELAASTTSFDMTETAHSQLSTFGCRHYMKLRLAPNAATLSPALDSADPANMDRDGSCGGEELPHNSDSRYPLVLKERTACGASVFSGTIDWTTSGAVKRTLTLTDYRGSTCAAPPARVVAAIVSSYQGSTNPIATYFSVDPR